MRRNADRGTDTTAFLIDVFCVFSILCSADPSVPIVLTNNWQHTYLI